MNSDSTLGPIRPLCIVCNKRLAAKRPSYKDGTPSYRDRCDRCRYVRSEASKEARKQKWHAPTDAHTRPLCACGNLTMKRMPLADSLGTARYHTVCSACQGYNRRYARREYRHGQDLSFCSACGHKAYDSCQMDVDHIDGNSKNHEPSNLQVLCASCHRLKTRLEQNHKWKREGVKIAPRLVSDRAYRDSLKPHRRRAIHLIEAHPYCTWCGFKAVDLGQLDVDHIDGDRNNNDPANLQVLCANCHRVKTRIADDDHEHLKERRKRLTSANISDSH